MPDGPVGNAKMFEVQKKLFELQLFSGKVDGYYGPKTAEAIRAFEQRNGMKLTGSTDAAVLEAILSSDAAGRVTSQGLLSREAGGERWTRTFAGRRFSSLQTEGHGRNEALLVERFGAVSVALAVVVEGGRLQLVPRRWSLLGIPLPRALLPGDDSFEYEVDGRFVFDVEIGAPLVGRIVHYRGTLEPA